jgi:hypothetical protein
MELPAWGVQKPLRGVLMWNRDSRVSIVLLHWWPQRDWSLWPHLRQASSRTITRPSYRQCDNPTWSHTGLLSWFYTRCRSSFRLHNRHSWLLGGSPVQILQSHCIHTQFHLSSGVPACFLSWGTQVQSRGGDLCETGVLLLALSRYSSENIYVERLWDSTRYIFGILHIVFMTDF